MLIPANRKNIEHQLRSKIDMYRAEHGIRPELILIDGLSLVQLKKENNHPFGKLEEFCGIEIQPVETTQFFIHVQLKESVDVITFCIREQQRDDLITEKMKFEY